MDRLEPFIADEARIDMQAGAVQGGARHWLRAEGLLVLLLALAAYRHFGFGWGAFALFFMAPDLTMLAYLKGDRFGAAVYNAAHSYIGPLLLASFAWFAGNVWYQPALIWLAHVGFCRMARFGLKYPDGFDHTHLGQAPFNLPRFLLGLGKAAFRRS